MDKVNFSLKNYDLFFCLVPSLPLQTTQNQQNNQFVNSPQYIRQSPNNQLNNNGAQPIPYGQGINSPTEGIHTIKFQITIMNF